jgi:cyclase
VGGGIKTLNEARDILLNGADKVSINTAAVKRPELITELMTVFGTQCVVVAVDVKRNYDLNERRISHNVDYNNNDFFFEVRIYGGKEGTGIDAIEWAKRIESLGAGEILLTSIDADGTENGYDIELYKAICENVRIPVIASGGCGSSKHMLNVFSKTDVDAVLAASIFHYGKISINDVKKYLSNSGVRMRL